MFTNNALRYRRYNLAMTKPNVRKCESVIFNGVKFNRYPESKNYSDRNYYRSESGSLHRVVWEFHNGPIPKGYHVHHKDGNTANNDISNLELKTKGDHHKLHAESMTDGRRKELADRMNSVRHKSVNWHGSEEGRAWHKKHGEEMWASRSATKKTCAYCGKEYETTSTHGRSKFCSNACKTRSRYSNKDIDGNLKTCVCGWCGREYQVYKYENRQKYCSLSCSASARNANRRKELKR